MRRVIFLAVIVLAVFSCTYGGSNSNGTADSAELSTDGTDNAMGTDSNAAYQKKSNERVKIETQ